MSAWYLGHLTLIQGMLINVPLALSFQIVLRSGVFSFASIGFYGIGGYGAGILAMHHFPAIPGMLIMIAASGLAAYVISIPLVRLRGLYLGMTTFAFDLILTVVANNAGSLTGGAIGLLGIPLGISTLGILISALIAVLLVTQLERGAAGRALLGIRVSDELAYSSGIDVNSRKRIVFAISAALGALSGALYVLTFSTIQPQTAGFSLVIGGLTMTVIGGIGSWIGAVIGTVIITWLPSVVSVVGQYQNLVYGVILVLVVIYAPDGVLGILKAGWRTVTRRYRHGRPPGAADTTNTAPGMGSLPPVAAEPAEAER
jgi:branched-chain amino acid transport system permease protein